MCLWLAESSLMFYSMNGKDFYQKDILCTAGLGGLEH